MLDFNSTYPISEYDAEKVYQDSANMSQHHYKMFLNQFYEIQDIKFRLSEVEKGGINKVDVKKAILDNGFDDIINEMVKEKLTKYDALLLMADNKLNETKLKMLRDQEQTQALFNKMYSRFTDLIIALEVSLLPSIIKVEINEFDFVSFHAFVNGKWSQVEINSYIFDNYYTKTSEDTYEKFSTKISYEATKLIQEMTELKSQINGEDTEDTGDIPF